MNDCDDAIVNPGFSASSPPPPRGAVESLHILMHGELSGRHGTTLSALEARDEKTNKNRSGL